MAKSEWNKNILSASEIAAKLTATFQHLFSRNAVIGVSNRDKGFKPRAARGVPKNRPPSEPRRPGRGNHWIKAHDLMVRKASIASASLIEPIIPLSDQDIPIEQRRTLLELLDGQHCKWPVGETPKDMWFCGATPTSDCVYCEAHKARAYTKYIKTTGLRPFRANIF